MNYPDILKDKLGYQELVTDLRVAAEEAVAEIGQDFAWLRYANILPDGKYEMLEGRQKQSEIITGIVEKVAKNHQQFSTGEIADIYGELVNS